MVKILPSGEIVPDDDSRAQAYNRAPPRPSSTTNSGAGGQRNFYANQQNAQHADQGYGGGSIFDSLNNRLLNFGIPRWNLGSFVVEPIYSVGTLIMMLMFGLPGILLIVILFVVSQLSRGVNFGQLYNNLLGRGQNVQTVRHPGSNSNRSNRQTSPNVSGTNSNKSDSATFGGSGRRLGD